MNRLQSLGAVVLALCLGLIGGYLWGGHSQAQIDEGRAAKVSEQHALALASATERYREAERSGQQAVAAITAAAQQEKENAKKQMDLLRDELLTGAVRLSVAVDAASAAAAAQAAAAGDREARADLLPAAAGRILDFALEGDDIVRELNACVDKYRRAEQMMLEAQEINLTDRNATGLRPVFMPSQFWLIAKSDYFLRACLPLMRVKVDFGHTLDITVELRFINMNFRFGNLPCPLDSLDSFFCRPSCGLYVLA